MRTAFLDIDGVLVDFVGAACELHEFSQSDIDWSRCGFQMYKGMGLTPHQFWSKIDEAGMDFWASLKAYPWADELWKKMNEITRNKVYLVSSPSGHPSSAAGKRLWLAETFGRQFSKYVLTNHKHLLARADRVLIDDSDDNATMFRSWNGQALVFPQPWNSNFPMTYLHENPEDVINYITEALKRFRQ